MWNVHNVHINLTSRTAITTKILAAPAAPAPAAATPAVRAADQPIKYQYYQSPASLSISVMAKNLAAEDVIVDIQAEHLRVVVLHNNAT